MLFVFCCFAFGLLALADTQNVAEQFVEELKGIQDELERAKEELDQFKVLMMGLIKSIIIWLAISISKCKVLHTLCFSDGQHATRFRIEWTEENEGCNQQTGRNYSNSEWSGSKNKQLYDNSSLHILNWKDSPKSCLLFNHIKSFRDPSLLKTVKKIDHMANTKIKFCSNAISSKNNDEHKAQNTAWSFSMCASFWVFTF